MKKYKILAISDEEILKKYTVEQCKEKFSDVDFILSAGDLSNEYLDYVFTILHKDLIYVNGNHVYAKKHNISFCKNIDGKVIMYKGLKIAGFDGSRIYSFKEHQYTELEMGIRIAKMIPGFLIRKPDIILTHAPPRKIHDREEPVHKGFKVFNRLLKRFKPKLWVHGHIHLGSHFEKQETMVDETRVVNAYGYKVIEIEI